MNNKHAEMRGQPKVVGLAVGILACAAAGVVEWPMGAIVYIFRCMKGRSIMAHPVHVFYPSTSRSFPI
ncbi:hypothetical protein MA16_Dca025571 [Dendrobium catenatum]|uniref:Uncharacterized protein n=1 Tax=Dendrobium catenatum TaxID=906689 RepID=A0A2I0XGM1_9ASPA|nr:hypothetical protein MA16_Dca025571 [Dendrobium catenatum]